MADGSTEPRTSPLPPGFTRIAGGPEGFGIGSAPWAAVDAAGGAASAVADRLDRGPVSGFALDLAGFGCPTRERTDRLVAVIDELQLRGRSVVAYGASADLATALLMDDTDERVATVADLDRAIALLREYETMRRRCVSERGRRVHQLRMPARTLSLAPLCIHVRSRLEAAGIPDADRLGLLREAYEGMVDTIVRARTGDEDLAAAVTVSGGRATVTILDRGPARENEVVVPGEGSRVDRIHRFRILDRHNALVLERDLRPPAEAGPDRVRSSPVGAGEA